MKLLAFDTETALIAPGRNAPPMACLTWAEPGKAGIYDPDVGWRRMRDALRDPETFVVGANTAYDLGVLAQHDPAILPHIFGALDAGRIGCTQVLSQLHYIAGKQTAPQHGLGYLSKLWLDRDMGGKTGGDSWRFHYRKLIGHPVESWPPRASEYAIGDAATTRDVFLAQQEWNVPDQDAQVRAAWALHVMGAWGFRVDTPRVFALDQRLRPPVEAVRAELTEQGIFREDGSKDTKLLRAMVEADFAARGKAPPTTATGLISTSEEVLRDCTDPHLLKLASIAKAEKELSAFLPMLLEAARSGLPVCPHWNVLVRSGRTSCRNPNAQQLPRRSGVRECIVPRNGNVFFGADYSIAELRSLAQVLFNLFGPNKMMQSLNAGQDLHVLTGGRILGIEYEEAKRRYDAKDPEMKAMRQLAKAKNFGFPGGLGAETFVHYAAGYGVNLTVGRSIELRRLWLDTFPEMKSYFSWVGRKVAFAGPPADGTSGSLATFRQPYSGRLRGRTGYTDGCNTMFQGLTIDGCKRAMYEICRRQLTDRRSALYGTRMNAFVHDEFLCEGPEEQAPEAADEMADVMVREMGVVAPDVQHEADPYIMRRWTKGAETIRDKSGRLLVSGEEN